MEYYGYIFTRTIRGPHPDGLTARTRRVGHFITKRCLLLTLYCLREGPQCMAACALSANGTRDFGAVKWEIAEENYKRDFQITVRCLGVTCWFRFN